MPPEPQQGADRSTHDVATRASLERVRSHILARFGTWFPDHGMDAARARVEFQPLGEPATYPLFTCTVFPRGGTESTSLIVKFTPVFSGHQEGRVEFEHLALMHERLGDRGELRVPRPLDFLPDLNVLITERVGGERFSRVLLRDATRGASAAAASRLESATRRCGAWLSLYHEALARGSAAAFAGDYETKIRDGLDALAGFGVPAPAADSARVCARDLAAWGSTKRVSIAVQHGDFGPQNVHVSEDHICVFDLSHHIEACVFDDINYFLVTLDTLNPYPRAWRFDRARGRALRKPFLEGYFGAAAANELETRILVEGYYLKALIARGLKQRRNTAKRGRVALAAFDHLWLRRRYADALRAQAARCEKLIGTSHGSHA